MSDLGSCANAPAQVAGMPGPTCASATVGPPDGVTELLLGLGGVDVDGVIDVGRAYVLDGKTLAILKHIDMPAARPRNHQGPHAENPIPPTGANLVRGGFGRTATNPRGLPPCAGNSGIGTCPTQHVMPPAVRIGDFDGGGVGDIVVGANQFPETAATAHPDSQCARDAGPPTCNGAGRAVRLPRRGDRGLRTRRRSSTAPAPARRCPRSSRTSRRRPTTRSPGSAGHVDENFGHSQIPVGDVGTCQTGGAFPSSRPASAACGRRARTPPTASRTTSSRRIARRCPLFEPDYSYFECGASILFDGATGAILYIYNHPEPQANALFGFTTGQQFSVGDLGDTDPARRRDPGDAERRRTAPSPAAATCSAGTSQRT